MSVDPLRPEPKRDSPKLMASLLEYDSESEERYRERIKKMVNGLRLMDDTTLWRFLQSLTFSASQHWDMAQIPVKIEGEFVLKHYEKPFEQKPNSLKP